MNWIKGDIAVYKPIFTSLERAKMNKGLLISYVKGHKYIVSDVLKCSCSEIFLDFGIGNPTASTMKCRYCKQVLPSNNRYWAVSTSFKKQSIEDFMKQRQIEKQFNKTMKITVLSQENFNITLKLSNLDDSNIELDRKYFYISINSTKAANEEFSESFFKENHPNVLVLHFDDVTEDGNVSPFGDDLGKTKAFSKEQARQVIDFLDKNKDKESCLLHCAAGISRSGAIGAFIADYFRVPYEKFKRDNPQVRPNPHVSSTLNKLLYER